MNDFNWDDLGKRLKSKNDITVFRRFPGSDDAYTLTAGKPSGLITSYVKKTTGAGVERKYFQIDNSDYIAFSDSLEIVPESAKDDSSFISSVKNKLADTVQDIKTGAGKNAGYLKEGFKKTTEKNFLELFEYAGLGKPLKVFISIIVILIVFQAINLILKFK